MVVRRRKKHRRFRGRRTYHGSHKKWRGGGSRGGRGKAGMHKHKWSYTVKYEPEHFGKRGFKRPSVVVRRYKAINLSEIDKIAEELMSTEKVEKGGNLIKIDLTNLGYEKVLGSGKISRPLLIVAKSFSRKAKEKIEKIGGKIVIV